MAASNPSRRQSFQVPEIIWGPLSAAALMVVIGVLGVVTHLPLLFPSLGPTAFLQTEDPELRAARFYNTVIGHLIGLFSGAFAVVLLGANSSPSALSSGQLAPARMWASALAIALTIAIGLILHAPHPPASATTLLVALGGFRLNAETILVVISGVLLIGLLGESLRRLRLTKLKKPIRPN